MGRRRRRGGSRRVGFLFLLALLLLAAAYVVAQRVDLPPAATRPPPAAEGTLRVHYVDVGQGDGTVWELPDGSIAVYDCGPPAPSGEEDALVRHLRDTMGRAPGSRIEALVVSHGHLDHAGGCDGVFDTYEVAHVYEAWYNGTDAPESYRRFQRAAEAEGAVVHKLPELAPGVRLALSSVDARLLWPRGFASGGWDAIAESSLVVRVQHGSTSFCFQGDIETQQEAQLDATCDVYLVGHHGSRYASSAEWLARMGPEFAVVSYGENSYGHPHPEAMCRIQQAGARIYVTEGAGAIVLESDGREVRVRTGKAEPATFCQASG